MKKESIDRVTENLRKMLMEKNQLYMYKQYRAFIRDLIAEKRGECETYLGDTGIVIPKFNIDG